MAVVKNSGNQQVKPNVVRETLYVGVGGIGSDIVSRVAGRCLPEERETMRFVAMDTDVNELDCVKNSKANIIPIQTSSTQSVLDYLNMDKSAMNEWFPVNTTLYGKTVSEGAGQVRAISRLALNATIKSGNISKLYKAIDDLFLKDGSDFKQALRVVIVSSISGGTGSGIAMLVGMLIREYLHEHYREKAAIIRGYLLLPGVCDTFGPGESEKDSLRRNGYATIKEINAFMIKASGFCGVRKDLERFKDLHIDIPTPTGETKRLEGLPFDFCFLLDRLNRAQTNMATLDQYKEFAAQSLYEQTVGPMSAKSSSMEDNVIKEFANGDNLGRNRFGGIGSSVLRYPYEEIVSYLAYSQAIERISDGGEEANSKESGVKGWLKYDKAFSDAMAEYKKKRAYSNESAPEINDIYVGSVNNGEDRFDLDIKAYLADAAGGDISNKVEDKINRYLDAFKQEITNSFMSRPSVSDMEGGLGRARSCSWTSYNGSDSLKMVYDKQTLDEFVDEIDRHARNLAQTRAKSILLGAPATKAQTRDYHLETLFKTTKGAMHPNAIRYLLYVLHNRVKLAKADSSKTRDSIAYYEEDQKSCKKELFYYSSEYQPADGQQSRWDVDSKYSKGKETTLDDICRTADADISQYGDRKENDQRFIDVMDCAESGLKSYYSCAVKYRDSIMFEAAYAELLKYVDQLSAEFEKFYEGFESKAFALRRKKTEIANSLKFRRGNSILNVCGKKEHLDALYEMCKGNDADMLLPDELNADIFDAVKQNAEVARLGAFDMRGAGERTDIFDDVLIDHFKSTVRENYDNIININIIRAIQLQQIFEVEAEQGIGARISDADQTEYIESIIKRGKELASPGIAFGSFDEDRISEMCAYHTSLDDMLDISVSNTLQKAGLRISSTECTTKYELRFLISLYNITPDRLSRFKNPKDCEDSLSPEEAGIYYTAYHNYSKKIGPDSTKSGTISAHIDKRWDTIVELPEISMNSQYAEMIRIHSALIYGIIHSMIITHPSSQTYDCDKRIFALENEDGDVTPLIVSNGTECDEFYEVLDALYRDNRAVESIFEMAKERRKFDIDANHNFGESSFADDVKSFSIGSSHSKETSLFEIPLVYYNSLPKAKIDGNELQIMVDAVIDVLENEVNLYEKDSDKNPFLAKCLEQQFKLFIDNFKDKDLHEKLAKGTTIEDNDVIRVSLRKVCNKIKSLGVSNFAGRIKELKEYAKGDK